MTIEHTVRDKVAVLIDKAAEARLTSRLATDDVTRSKFAQLADDFDKLVAEATLALQPE